MQTLYIGVAKLFSRLVVLSLIAFLASCGDNRHPDVALGAHRVEVPVGVSSDVTVTLSGPSASAADAPSWKIADATIANATYKSGHLVVTGVAVGTTQAVGEYHGQDLTVDVVVTDAALLGLSLSAASITLPRGLNGPIAVAARYTDGAIVDVSSQVTWTIDDPTIAEFSNGRIHGLKSGTTMAHATFGDETISISITVTDAVLVSLQVDPPNPRLPHGLSLDLTATGLLSDGSAIDATPLVAWSSSATAIATVSSTGRVMAIAPGTSTLTAAIEEIAGATVLTVTGANVTRLVISPDGPTLPVGDNLQLRAIAQLDDGTTTDVSHQVTWTSATPAVATIDANGNVHGAAAGTSQITAALGTVASASTTVTVGAQVLAHLEIQPDPLTLAVGTIAQLHAVGVYSDGTTVDLTGQAVWSSDHILNATVVGGTVVALLPGTATVTAQVGGLTATGTIHVTSATVLSLTVSAPVANLPLGATEQLEAIAHLSDGTSQDVTSQSTWTSAAKATISVSNAGTRGQATALAVGSAAITATLGSVSGSVTITATNATLTRIDLTPPAVNLAAGSAQAVVATGVYSDGTTLDLTDQVLWTSSAPAVATVSNSPGTAGTVTGKTGGDATITAQLGGVTATLAAHISNALLIGVTINPSSASLAAGTSAPLTATASYSDGSTQDVTAAASWMSSAPATVSVSNVAGSNGVVTAHAQGGATVSATFSGTTATAQVTVTAATLTAIQVTPPTLTLAVGATGGLTATGVFSDGTTQDLTSQVTWTSSAPAVASVSAGQVSATAIGTATITATSGTVSGSAAITVGAGAIATLAIDPPTVSLPLLQTSQLTATATYSDATTADVTQQATWSSSNPLVASVSNAAGTRGQITGLLPGTATITATAGGKTATATVTVSLAVLTSISTSPGMMTLPAGQTSGIQVIATYSDGSSADVTSQATFSSSNPAVATVSAGGSVTALTPGAATITAAVGLATATTSVTVTTATLQHIQITPSTLSLPAGTTGALTAVGVYSDGSHQDLTATATWTSSAPATATVSNAAGQNGKVTAVAPGSATITATANGVTATAPVTVTTATASGLAIDPANPSVPLLGTFQLTATATFTDATTLDVTPLATWTSSNPLVVSVSNAAGTRGRISALLPGTATITATYNGQTATTTATATVATLVSTTVTPSSLDLPAGTSAKLAVTGTYSDGTTHDLTAQATFSSNHSATASVAADGTVTANAPGTATITATVGLTTSTATVTVTPATLSSITLAPTALSLPLGTTGQLTATGHFSDGSTQDLTSTATWTSSAPGVATVGNLVTAGKVTPVAAGTATITATLGTTTATADVTITGASLASLAITPATPSVALGQAVQLTATGTYSDGSTQDNTQQATWTSSNPLVAAVSNAAGSHGRVTGLLPGTATITATYNGQTASVPVTTTLAVLVGATVDAGAGTVPAGLTLPVRVIGTYSDGTTADITAQANLSSSNTGVATVSANGTVTGIAPGQTTITAAVGNGVTASANVNVIGATLGSIQISPTSLGVPAGTTGQLTAVGVYSDGSHVDLTQAAVWSSSNPAAATVSSLIGTAGTVTGVAPGAATITAAFGNVTGTAPVTVTSAALTSLAIDPPAPSMALGQLVQLTATGMFSDGTTHDVTTQATWTSSNPLVASVSSAPGSQGLVLGLLAGTTTITATLGAQTATATITVTSAVLVSAALDPGTLVLPSGLSAPLTLIGTYSDGTTADITAQANFSSTNPAVVSVSSGGLVTAGAPGTATITASAGSVNAQVVVNSVAAALQSIQVTPTALSLPLGGQGQLAATGIYSDGSHQDLTTLATWTSSASGVASVGNLLAAGKVTAATLGTATVTATFGALHTDVPVTVTAAALGDISITPPAPTVYVAQTVQLTATGLYSDNSTLDLTQQATWASSSPLVAAVSNLPGQRGKVTGLLAGTATISATYGGVTQSVTVTSSPATLVSLSMSPAVLTVPNGLSQQITVTGTYSDGTQRDLTSQASFSSSNPSVASVSTSGAVTGHAPGIATVTATLGGVSTTLPVTVSPATLQQVQISPSSLALPVGTSSQLMASGVYSDGSHADLTAQVTWTSSAPAVASVSNVILSSGRVTGNSTGDATLTAALAGVSAQVPVHVGAATLQSIAVTGNTGPVPLGLTAQLTATGTYSDGTTADVTNLATWASTSGAVVASNAAGTKGLVTAASVGPAVVSATVGSVVGETTINATGAQLLSIDIPTVASLPVGTSAQLQALGHYSDGSVVDVSSQVAWTSSNPVVAAVSATGNLTGLGVGTSAVTASLGGVSSTQTVGISAAALQILVVSPSVATLAIGQKQTLIASGTFSDGSIVDLTAQVTWSSDHPERASVTNAGNHGVVTAVATGLATITAQQGNVTAHAVITVTPAVLTAINVTGLTNGSIALGQIAPLTATATYSDGSTTNVTNQAVWTSSNPTSVVVSTLPGSQGKATAIANGAATISATIGTVQGSIGVNVGIGCHVVINEVKTGALLSVNDEFIELYNPCSFSVDLSHETLAYRTIAGVVDVTLNTLTGAMAPNTYRVYGGSAYGGPVDGSFSTDLPALGGGIAIRDANVIYDSMGYGIAVNLFVEGAVSLQIPVGQTLARIPNGYDSNNNAADFQIRTPTPGAANQ